MDQFLDLRLEYHRRVTQELIRIERDDSTGFEFPNLADKTKKSSMGIAWSIIRQLGYLQHDNALEDHLVGRGFEEITRDYLQKSFDLLQHLRPRTWHYATGMAIAEFDQYEHLAALERLVENSDELATALGKEYIIKPDIVVARYPVSDEDINQQSQILDDATIATLTPLRQTNRTQPYPLLHASISCKWTLRSDREQNSRTEALNLIRHRKGHLPHVVAVTAEPLPTRIASLALGTGDIDCVYHFALYEMQKALVDVGNEDQADMLETLIEGRRLRDISDLPFDLAI